MKRWPILTVALEREADVVAARQRARRIAELLAFDTQDQTRIATAVSEIARNAHAYGRGGKVAFVLAGYRRPERFVIRVDDEGPGISDTEAALEGRLPDARSGGLGIVGARRLMDVFEINSAPGEGVQVVMAKALPQSGAPLTPERLADVARVLTSDAAADPMMELRAQNQELLLSLQALETRRIEAVHLSEELERTNKGVVALYAELDRRAEELERLNATLEQRVAQGVADRAQVEERLRQSQKMEAVGQLTGGIAHDFNNLLMIIGGSLEMLRRRVPAQPDVDRLIEAAIQGVARGGALNQQLLAFARRQDLKVETVCVSEMATSFLQLIERAVSEDIAVRTERCDGCWYCRTDPHQLETAVLNLAINARDAMPRGGTLTLAIANRQVDAAFATAWEGTPGDYVVVSVADTGAGMEADVVARVFEPFFTTKEVGRGTGLGLSQVYGFAKQSGGFVAIESEPGKGARVEIHMPRAEPSPTAAEPPKPVVARVRGSASILVVEDHPAVRATTSHMLRDLGYDVLEATSGRQALELFGTRKIDLVFSDVVLPDGMSGVELARAIRCMAPTTPVLLTSGYTAQHLDMSDEMKLRVLGKPYSEAQLSEGVRLALEGAGAG